MRFLSLLFSLTLFVLFINFPVYSESTGVTMGQKVFFGKSSILSEQTKSKMKEVTWRKGCPVPLNDLRQLDLIYWTPQNEPERGQLIVHQDVVEDLLYIFEMLYDFRFPIESMRPMHEFKGNDDDSMAANNTSAFNCRPKTGRAKGYSVHSYGRAIDINPLWNPYVRQTTILPPGGRDYLNREICKRGMICFEDATVALFKSKDWTWGGGWRSLKDYQHFQKR